MVLFNRKGTHMPNPEEPGFEGFDFEQLRRLLEQLGIQPGAGFDPEAMMRQFAAGGAPMQFGMTNADRDPEAAWRTTLTAAKQLADETGPDVAATPQDRLAVIDSERLVQTWLDAQTEFPQIGLPPETLRRSEWLEETSAGWRAMVEPIIQGLGEALERSASPADVPELGALTSMLAPMMRPWASIIYRDRLRKVLAETACSTLSGTEIGINLMSRPRVAVLPTNVADFTRDLELSESDIVLYLLLREAARVRLFHHVTWLGPQLAALLAHFAREIVIDFESLSAGFDPQEMGGFTLEDVVAVGEKVRGSFFKPASTPTQLEILGRLEVLLVLIEGWVDHVTSSVSSAWLPNAGQLQEIIRRRRASGGAPQEVFRQLLGLEIRPRLVRDAENLWAAIEHERGVKGRDDVWHHPDLLPTAKHLADPLSYGHDGDSHGQPDEMDLELRKLLDGGA